MLLPCSKVGAEVELPMAGCIGPRGCALAGREEDVHGRRPPSGLFHKARPSEAPRSGEASLRVFLVAALSLSSLHAPHCQAKFLLEGSPSWIRVSIGEPDPLSSANANRSVPPSIVQFWVSSVVLQTLQNASPMYVLPICHIHGLSPAIHWIEGL